MPVFLRLNEKKEKKIIVVFSKSPDDVTSNAFNKENKYPAMADARQIK